MAVRNSLLERFSGSNGNRENLGLGCFFFGRSGASKAFGASTRYSSAVPEAVLSKTVFRERKLSPKIFVKPPWGHGRPRLRVMDVRTEMLFFPGFRGPDRSFCPRTSAGKSARTSAGYPAPKPTVWVALSFLSIWSVSDL